MAATAKPASKSEILAGIAETTGLSRKQVASVFDALSAQIKRPLGKKGPGMFAVPGLMKITVVHKPAVKARKGINPFTKLEQMFKAKPARKVVKVRAAQEPQGHGEISFRAAKGRDAQNAGSVSRPRIRSRSDYSRGCPAAAWSKAAESRVTKARVPMPAVADAISCSAFRSSRLSLCYPTRCRKGFRHDRSHLQSL